MKKFKINDDIKSEVKQWCLDNLGTESVRWWFDEDLIGLKAYSKVPSTLTIDVTEEEEHNLTFFILQYDQ